jgi:deazaflavin-dependent oxidoreductase (nitroreductase family)
MLTLRDLLCLRDVATRDHDVVPLRGESGRCRLAHAAAAARDDDPHEGIVTRRASLIQDMTEIDKDKLVADAAALDDFNRGIVEEFRANGGKVGGPFEGGNLLLLHTTGAKSGKARLSPLAFLDIDGKTIIVGSYAGAPKDPAWVHNLRATPLAHIEVGTDAYDVTARELPDDERDATYPKVTERAPVFAEYQAKTDRAIPLFELVRN